MADNLPILLKPMIDIHVTLVVQADLKAEAADYRRGWPEAVNPLAWNRQEYPDVIPVDKTIPIAWLASRLRLIAAEETRAFADDPNATTRDMQRYVLYVNDGFGWFGRHPAEVADALLHDRPLTLLEGMFLLLHHGRTRPIRHGVVCAASRDAQGRYPVLVAVSNGFMLTAVEPDFALFRYAVARRGIVIPWSM